MKRHDTNESPEHRVWRGMNARCSNPNHNSYEGYGGRGITVCEKWRFGTPGAFEAFLSDMGKKPSDDHSIDRIDTNRNYCPENCRWATRIEQAQNTTKSRRLEYNGMVHVIAEWARIVRKSSDVLLWRLNNGWSARDALYHPVRKLSPRGSRTLASRAELSKLEASK